MEDYCNPKKSPKKSKSINQIGPAVNINRINLNIKPQVFKGNQSTISTKEISLQMNHAEPARTLVYRVNAKKIEINNIKPTMVSMNSLNHEINQRNMKRPNSIGRNR